MASQASPSRFEWLMETDGEGEPLQEPQLVNLSDGIWTARIERIEVSECLRVSITDADLRSPFTITAHHNLEGRWLFTNVVARGRTVMEIGDEQCELDANRSAFFRAPGREAQYALFPGSLRIAALMLRADRLARLLDDAPPALLRRIAGDDADEAPVILPTPTSDAMRRLVLSMQGERLTGALRRIFVEGAALQLFALQVAGLANAVHLVETNAPKRNGLSTGERDRMFAARELLLADMREPPSLGALAEAVGFSEKALNAGFRQLFGATIFEVLRNERLDHARLALEQGEVPIKVIADRVGYRHVSNFISAFTRRFGAPPARYVRGRLRDDDGQAAAPEG